MKTFSTQLNLIILFTILTISIIGMPSMAQSQAPAFFSVIDDLPLMPGLREDVDGALSFDTANGRIAETTASGLVKAGTVIDYYARTLPQLGWKFETLFHYMREGEALNIEVEKSKAESTRVLVHFRLSPAGVK